MIFSGILYMFSKMPLYISFPYLFSETEIIWNKTFWSLSKFQWLQSYLRLICVTCGLNLFRCIGERFCLFKTRLIKAFLLQIFSMVTPRCRYFGKTEQILLFIMTKLAVVIIVQFRKPQSILTNPSCSQNHRYQKYFETTFWNSKNSWTNLFNVKS